MKRFLLLAMLFTVIASTGAIAQENSAEKEYGYELYVRGIEVPWGMDWLPNGNMLVTERAGGLLMFEPGPDEGVMITGLPDDIYVRGQGGLLDVKVHPDYEENGWIYFAYSSSTGEGDGANTAIIRAKLDGTTLVDIENIYKGSPNATRGVHYAGRIEFDNDGYLFFSIGDRGSRDVNPQDLTKDGGKIYRLMADGTVPSDNPFVNQAGAKTATYSYGHRNPQGMEMNPATGKIWAHEHGPRGGDELNIVEPGKNYGWPVISYGINYNGTSFTDETERDGMVQPITYWVPSIAPSGLTFVTSDTYPDWKGHALVGSLKFGYVHLVKLDGDTVIGREQVLSEIGRVRSVEQGPDGNIYIGVDSKGIYKVTAE